MYQFSIAACVSLESLLTTADLLEELCKDDESAWATYNRGKPVSPRQLSRRLGEFGVRPGSIRVGFNTKKGYYLDQFRDAFTRYLASQPVPSVTAAQSLKDGVYRDLLSVTNASVLTAVTDEEMPQRPSLRDCFGVTDKVGVVAGIEEDGTDMVEGSL